MLYSEYSNPGFVFDAEINFALDIIDALFERKNEEKMFQRWIVYQSEMSFEEFKNKLGNIKNNKYDKRSSKEILNNVKNILENYKF
ncbi:hypothetical protein [Parvimonas micra]|uniref:Uncharacterized protein n=1 Tax=Parvimonas micra ATCC 33270 TaxID=411465 RepID=A8SKP8_9FIRM|nr:hypothetical protein [Parvimonas micra]EDP24163.1 hypothetical protein PEPMIC_00743 [Parvimonas micra ATCC 33270]RSB90423.1 hypothetical protein EGS00_01240 [Parvimonas micra]VEH96935.1 Uncharacterised protein [Parvimonas micra]